MDGNPSAPIVFDVGSGFVKAGFGGDDAPRAMLYNIVGRPRNVVESLSFLCRTRVGDEALFTKGTCKILDPVERGKIVLWDDWEKVMRHTFYNELRSEPEDHPVVMALAPLTDQNDKEKISQILFETFQVPSLYLENNTVCSLVECGRTDGLVLDSGYAITHAVPVLNGISQDDATLTLEMGGNDLTRYLTDFAHEKGLQFFSRIDLTVTQDMKEKHGRVSQDVAREIAEGCSAIDYELPDGKIFKIEKEQFLCAEPLFNPQLLHINQLGIHEMIHESIQKCELGSRKQLYENIVLAGGSSLFKGMKERLTNELKELISPSINLQVHQPEYIYTKWIGASICSVLESKKQNYVTRQQYEENGSNHPSNHSSTDIVTNSSQNSQKDHV